MATFNSVYNNNQGSFNNPRQKLWAVLIADSNSANYWRPVIVTNDYQEAQQEAKYQINYNRWYVHNMLDKVLLVEVVPMDFVVTPNV